jgi:hypothetical protein
MGPATKAALVARQQADSEFQGAVLEELQGIREAINKLAGRHSLETESINERVETVEKRVSQIERVTGSAG